MQWVSFFYKNNELCSYDLKNTFPGELDATKNVHCFELNCGPDEIEVFIVEKGVKKYRVLCERGNNLIIENI